MPRLALFFWIILFTVATKSQETYSNLTVELPSVCEPKTGGGCGSIGNSSADLVTTSQVGPRKILESVDWINPFHGKKNFKERIDQYVDPKKGHIVKAILERPLSKVDFNLIIIHDLEEFKKDEMFHYMKKRYTFMTPDRLLIVTYEKEDKTWYLQRFNPTAASDNLVMGERIAVSKCLITMGSEGGYISSTFKVTLRIGTNAELVLDIYNPLTTNTILSYASLFGVGDSIALSGSVTCTFEKGRYAQPFLHPFYIHIPEGERVPVEYTRGAGLVITGEWQKTPSGVKVAAVAPLVECVLGNSSLVCHTKTRETLHLTEISELFSQVRGGV